MKVGIITDSISEHISGVGRYSKNILKSFASSEHEIVSIDWRNKEDLLKILEADFSNNVVVANVFPFFKNLLWHFFLLLKLKRSYRVFDVILDCSQFLHIFGKPYRPYIYVVHDLSFFKFPECHRRGKYLLFRFFFKKTIDKADHIVCVSNYTRNTLLHYFPNYIEKTSVIYEAAEDRFKPIYNTKKLNNIADKYNLEDKFFLFVGTIEPRKNLENVFRAYHKFKNEISFPLYIVGKIGWRTDNLLKLHKELNLDGKIRMLGYIPDADLPALYNLATAFVYISIDEGFGLPLLEAMQCGTPSIVSNAGSLPEIAGDAALIVDPNSVDHIGKALQRLSVDKQLKDTLIKKGLLRSSNFRWQKTVSELSMLFFELTQKYR